MEREHSSTTYEWYYSRLYGVGRFKRLSDGALTPLETGSDAQAIREALKVDATLLDSIAALQIWSPRQFLANDSVTISYGKSDSRLKL